MLGMTCSMRTKDKNFDDGIVVGAEWGLSISLLSY